MSIQTISQVLLSCIFFSISIAQPFLGEVRVFAGNFPPRGWLFCHGQSLPIAQNSALFSLLGTIYGGDGRTTFNLPDLRGRVIVSAGDGVTLGQVGGSDSVTLTASNIPSHSHSGNVMLTVPGFPLPSYSASTTIDFSSVSTRSHSVQIPAQTCPIEGISNIETSIPLVLNGDRWEKRRWRRKCRRNSEECRYAAEMFLVPNDSVLQASPKPTVSNGPGAQCEDRTLSLSSIQLEGSASAATTISSSATDVPDRQLQATVNVNSVGSGNPFGSRDPFVALNYIIATTGTFPSRA